MSSFELQQGRHGKYQQIPEPAPSIVVSSLHTDEEDTHYHGHHPESEPEPGVAAGQAPARARFEWPSLFTLLGTILFGTLIIIVVRIYQLRGNISKGQKHAFNTLSTGLILFLGLSFFEAFKSLAKAAGPRIARSPSLDWNKDEKHLIEKLDSLLAVLELAKSAWIKNWTIWFCIAWIALNILAQVAVAAISLTWEANDGTNWNGTYLRPGNVTAARLNCYDDIFNSVPCSYPKANDTNLKTIQALAHVYGELALSNQCCTYETNADVLTSGHDCRYFCRRDRHNQEFQYRFKEFNPDDFNVNVSTKAYPHFTNRTISASGNCSSYSVENDHITDSGCDHYFEYKNADGSVRGNITIPQAYIGISSTTYIYRGLNPPQNAPAQQCGDRCTIVWAYRGTGDPFDSTVKASSQIYQCNVTVTAVTNTTDQIKELPDDMARLAAASISLSGRKSGPGPNDWNQYQFYPLGFVSHFTTHLIQSRSDSN
ncbi:MAG: hypothetical protein OHK93_001591 [Ramalina farinacea]|uniref:Uncharacterized protein n=1 Tax=Ramalina farinacea TaxID=258253 RepID=A0AA43QRJ0_9LECA|nr:hypothetical protein [Ramalina farinacea]